MKRHVLVVAAEQFELAPIRRKLAGRESPEFVLVAQGPGAGLARKAVESAGGAAEFDAFVSVGLCGALEAGLEIASIVVGSAVNGVPIAMPRWDGLDARTGPLASIDYVAGTVEEKRKLGATGAIAVEMEAAAVLEVSRGAGRPFYAVKAVSDRSNEGFSLDLNAARDESGRFGVKRILGQAVRSPLTAFPELVRLGKNSQQAANALGEFFAHCTF